MKPILLLLTGEETSDVHRYDIAGDKWTEVEKALPEPVSVALCFALGDKIVMFGGEVTPSERGHAGAGNFRQERAGGRFFTSNR